MSLGISVIIPVFNESHIISRTIRHIQNLEFRKSDEIIVVDGNPIENTIASITDKTVKKASSTIGRGTQMNQGAKLANGSMLLFLHADTRLAVDALSRIENTLNKPGIVGGAFDLGIQSDRFAYRLIEAAASYRSRVTRIPYGDQAIFIRKAYFEGIGGYREIPIMEDVELMKRVKSQGARIEIIKQPVMTSPRRWESEGILYCTLRNWMLITLYSIGVSPEKLARFYKRQLKQSESRPFSF
jgi:rSAM/selenodomain-associated transferase 2